MWKRSLVLGLVLLPLACTTVRPVDAPVPYLATNRPGAVLISGPDGQEFELGSPRLQADSLVGIHEGEPVRIALSNVRQMKAPQINRQRTMLFSAAVAVGVAAAIWGFTGSQGEGTPIDTSYKIPCMPCADRLPPTNQARVRTPQIRFSIPF